MLDPASIATAVSLSTAAFNNLKKAFAVGRDIESMGNDLSRWMKASSDIDQAVKSTKNPPFYKKFLSGDSVEQPAVKSLIAQYIKLRFGVKAWDDLLKMEGQIRKQRQEQIYKSQQLKQSIMEVFFMAMLVLTIVGFIIFIFWLKRQKDGN